MRRGFALAQALLLLVSACDEGGTLPADAGHDVRVFDLQQLEGSPDAVVVDQRPSSPDRCGGGELLDLSSGVAEVSGDTSELTNEYGNAIRCGGDVPLAGPQRYYGVELEAGRAYRLALAPSFDAALYLFSACAIDMINGDCSEDDGAGVRISHIAAGEQGQVVFWPDATGRYEIAVDSYTQDAAGSFTLRVEAFAAADESRCADAAALTFEQGIATIAGVTLGAVDEFAGAIGCNTGLSFAGPQTYYALDLQAGTSYRLELEADFAAVLYAFSDAAGCVADNIELDCGGIGGTVLVATTPGAVAATRFSPLTSGRYFVAVDSLGPRIAGELTLRVTEESASQNESCTAATALALSAGAVEVTGDTSGLLNDRGALMQCAGRPLLGPQRYYRIALEARNYQLVLEPAFDAVLALGQSCELLPADCQSAGLTGSAVAVAAGTRGTLTFTPAQPQELIVAVDSARADAAGVFKLQVIESSPAQNGVCGAPEELALGATVAGETGPLHNDLSPVSCGSAEGPFDGPQAYFRLALTAGQRAEVVLDPEPTFDAALYAFDVASGCDAAAVDAACAGHVLDTPQPGASERIELVATADTDFVVVVDSWSPSEVGHFTLTATLLP